MVRDPRHWQLAVQSGLLAYGLSSLAFEVSAQQIVLTVGTALSVQALLDWAAGRRAAAGLESALISALSLCLLFRTSQPWMAVAAAALAIGSKFALRVDGRHVFNPTNFAIAALLATSDTVWVSPGQWGSAALFAATLCSVGALVVTRAVRWDVTAAFLACYATLLLARAWSVGEPLAIPLHRLQSGSLLLFSFFMISDPKTTPCSRTGRLVFAALVAYGAFFVQFRLFRTNGLMWSLVVCSTLVPLLNRWYPALPFHWPGQAAVHTPRATRPHPALESGHAIVRATLSRLTFGTLSKKGTLMLLKRLSIALVVAAVTWTSATPLAAFCGFYVAKADASLYNQASRVVLVRDGDRTVITMVNDFRGPVTEFAMVVPVPTFIERGQIHVADKALVDHLDAFTAPRLVEYFDTDPCMRHRAFEDAALRNSPALPQSAQAETRAKSLGVTIEASYTVGEYDILVLSAQQSSGLATWLTTNGYRVPKGSAPVLASYIAQGMRFFVAKVNLTEHARAGQTFLRPLQVAYESPKFMLPLRLGMINAAGPQDLLIYALSSQGRVETTNYRTVKLPTDVEIPTFVRDPQEFARFYHAMFSEQVRREAMHAVFTEHAWDMAWCDPCAADPLSADELRHLGVFWSGSTFVTRLHVRYDAAHFPEDLVFQQTSDKANFQGRYILRHPWTGGSTCEGTVTYRRQLADREAKEAQTLASLTGWPLQEIRRKMGVRTDAPAVVEPAKWWERIWRP